MLASSFAPDGSLVAAIGTTPSTVNLPGSTVSTDSAVRVMNMGPNPVIVALGATVSLATGMVLLSGQTEYLTRGTATQITAVCYLSAGVSNSALYVTTGS